MIYREVSLTTENSFILYSEVDIGDDLVDCIYLVKDECRAQPFVAGDRAYYKPTEDEKKGICKEAGQFRMCPRLQAYQAHLRAMGLEREERR